MTCFKHKINFLSYLLYQFCVDLTVECFSVFRFHIRFAINPYDLRVMPIYTRKSAPFQCVVTAAAAENFIFIDAMVMGEENVPVFRAEVNGKKI